jgi:uncharacterized protein YutE (UPF0331/DUF86 family)
MPPSSDEIEQKLVSLQSYVDQLLDILAHPAAPDRPHIQQRVVERLLQIIVECAADAGDLWLDKKGHPLGGSARGVFQGLREVGAISRDLDLRFAEHVRARNRIVRGYDQLEERETMDQAGRLPEDTRALLLVLSAW